MISQENQDKINAIGTEFKNWIKTGQHKRDYKAYKGSEKINLDEFVRRKYLYLRCRIYILQTNTTWPDLTQDEINQRRIDYQKWLYSDQFDIDWHEHNLVSIKQLTRDQYGNYKAIQHLKSIGEWPEDDDFSDLIES